MPIAMEQGGACAAGIAVEPLSSDEQRLGLSAYVPEGFRYPIYLICRG